MIRSRRRVYKYCKEINSVDNVKKIERLDLSDNLKWEDFFHAVKKSVSNDRFAMNNPGLIAFWTRLGKSVYYLEENDAYIIADFNGENLFIKQIIADHKVPLDVVISSFGNGVKNVALGFTPYDVAEYSAAEFKLDDCTLFILGKDLEIIENEKLMFPILSHA